MSSVFSPPAATLPSTLFILCFFAALSIAIQATAVYKNTTGTTPQSQAPILLAAGNITEEDFEFLDALEFVDPVENNNLVDPTQPLERAANDDDDAKPNATVASSNVAVKKCVPLSACYKHEDCGQQGKKGGPRCVGVFVGKCDCTACVSGLPCSSEATCGGLHNSCSNVSGICDCIKAHKANGFANFGQALLRFCNHQDCDEDSNTCFGLPCRRGRCVCI